MDRLNLEKTIVKIRKGRTKYFEDLVNEYEKKVYGFIYSIVKDCHQAEDLTQEVFIKVYRNLGSYNSNNEFSTWILTIARNTSIDYLRKHSKLRIIENVQIESDMTPEREMISRELTDYIDNYVMQLPSDLKNLILMKYFDELSYQEIARRLKVDEKRVKWQLYDARQRLMKMIDIEEVLLWNAK